MTTVLPQTERIPQMQDDELDLDALVWIDENNEIVTLGSAAIQLLFHNQKEAAVTSCLTAETAVTLLICHYVGGRSAEDVEGMLDQSLSEAKLFVREQLKHLEEYMKLRQRDDIPPQHARFGSKIDRVARQTSTLLGKTIDLYELPEKLKIRRDFVEETERRRAERLERRRQRQASAATTMAPPPVPVNKREKEEREPLCDKCGKRPRVSGTLCQKCAEWMMRR
jgi:hypothetical protein